MFCHLVVQVIISGVLFEYGSAFSGPNDLIKYKAMKSSKNELSPTKFEIKDGPNVATELEKYIQEISTAAKANNATANYKVKVEFVKNEPINPMTFIAKSNEKKKKAHKKKASFFKKTKKYQVPLKKKPVHLSPFDMIMKRLAEEEAMVPVNQPTEFAETTKMEEMYEIRTTKAAPVGKYKPILNRHRMKFGYKKTQPVRSKIFVLHK